MAELPLRVWQDFIWKLRQVNDQAEARIRAYIAKYRIPQTYEEYQQFLDYAYAVSTKFGEAAGEIAAEMYEAEARAAKVIVKAAVPAEPPSIAEVAKTVFGTVKTGNEEIISSAVGRLVKKTGANTTLKNAIRDGAQYAWIPHGDTCAFCIMLASNGWMSGGDGLKNGQAAHIHANCDCTYGVRFDGKSGVAGYDPDKYKEMYDNAEGDTWQEKLNSMRRDEYAANADKINAMKRELYAEKNERKYLGVPKTWEKTLEAAEDEILRGTNPEYKPGLSKYASAEKLDYNDNCANSVVAYEMRCRGYDVTAQPYSANKKLSTNPFSAWEDGEGKVIATKNIDAISEYMESMPDGARVQVALKYPKSAWYDLTDHTFIVERKSGKTVFKDPQSGTIIANTNDAFRGAELFEYLRIDNVDITDRGISACKRRN